MTSRPKFELSRLREIGWRLWDPIGLTDVEDWPEDEYDAYLLQAAARLWSGITETEVVDYLVRIEIEHMGLGPNDSARDRAFRVVSALVAYTGELRT
jgi:hypothetical protein